MPGAHSVETRHGSITRRALAALHRVGRCVGIAAGLLGAWGHVVPAYAQDYPNRVVTIVVPFPTGGVDSVPRLIAGLLSQQIGQTFIVENKPGATQMIGMRAVAQAKPDGYTLLWGTATGVAINPSLRKEVPFDPVKSFEPVSLVYSTPLFLVIRRDIPANSVSELIDLARRQPGRLNYASGGMGSSSHLAAELLKIVAGIDMTHVPYTGTAPAIRDVMGGYADLMFISTGLQYAAEGRVKVLGVSGEKRVSSAPDVPTLAEAGAAGYAATTWFGFLAPAGTPRDIVDRLAGEVRKIIHSGVLQQRLRAAANEMQFVGSSPEEFGAFIKAELARWRTVIKAANIPQE